MFAMLRRSEIYSYALFALKSAATGQRKVTGESARVCQRNFERTAGTLAQA